LIGRMLRAKHLAFLYFKYLCLDFCRKRNAAMVANAAIAAAGPLF
jgi:hypothetical protein